MGFGDEFVEIFKCAEHGVDVAVIADIVAEIFHGGFEERRDPDSIDAEAGYVVEFFCDAGEVTHAVSVCVEERAWVDLVENGMLPF